MAIPSRGKANFNKFLFGIDREKILENFGFGWGGNN